MKYINKSQVIVFAAFCAISISFNNCGAKKFVIEDSITLHSSGDELPTGLSTNYQDYVLQCLPAAEISQKVMALIAPQESKLHVDWDLGSQAGVASDSRKAQAAGSVETGEKLVVTMNEECLSQRGSLSELSSEIVKNHKGLFTKRKGSYELSLNQKMDLEKLNSLVYSDDCIEFVDKNVQFKVIAAPNDPSYTAQSHLKAIKHDEIYTASVNAANGINTEIRVGVIDTGVEVTHPDLIPNFVMVNNAVLGYNAIAKNSNVQDSGFHGTHVAGLIAAASDNAVGVSGVMGKYVKILPVRVSNDGSSIDLAAATDGVYWAVDNGVRIINMSFGGNASSTTLKKAIDYGLARGVLFVIAAGNDNVNLSSTPFYPANYSNSGGVITVGSVNGSNLAQKSSFSNYSSTFVEMMAPGSDSSTPTGLLSTVPFAVSSTGYARSQGTSMASPLVSGAAAIALGLVLSRGFDVTAAQLETFIKNGSDSIAANNSIAANGKTLNLKSLVTYVDAQTGINSFSDTSRATTGAYIAFSEQPTSANKLTNGSIQFKAVLTTDSTSLASFQWYHNNQPIEGATSATLTLSNIQADDAGFYVLQVKAGSNIVVSKPAIMKVSTQACP